MVSSLSNPPILAKPFAENGDKTSNIPTSATGTQAASLDEGFPPVTSTPINEGGIPPLREDFNGLGYLTTSQFFYLQMGGRFTFNSAVSNAIGGYPQGAVLQYTDPGTGQSYEVTSLIPNNTYNFVTTPSYIDGVKWRKSFSEDLTNYMTYSVLGLLYPVGSIYIGTQAACPLSTLIPGSTWSLVSSGKALWTSNGNNAGSTISAGLPNITGKIGDDNATHFAGFSSANQSGAFYTNTPNSHYTTGTVRSAVGGTLYFDASRSSSIYGNSTTVQPPAYVVNVWRRTA